jgi:hypothetical protein
MANPKQPLTGRRVHRRAWVSVASLLVMLAVLQPLTLAAADIILPSHPELLSYQSWSQYLRAPAPDVVFVGSSRVVSDIDRQSIAQAMSARLGHPVTVGFIGATAGQTYFLDAVAYRIMHRSPHPRLVVLEMSEFQYNRNYRYDNTADLWVLGRPPDLDFNRFALRVAPDRERYLRGVAFPLYAYYKFLAFGVSKDLVPAINAVQRVGHFLHHGELTDPYIDFSGAVDSGPGRVMSPEVEAASLDIYAHQFLRDYTFDAGRLEYLAEAISVVRGAGGNVALAVLPQFAIDRLTPAGYAEFLSRAHDFGDQHQAPLLDYHLLFQDQRPYWIDPSHLNLEGRRALGPVLGAGIAPFL